VLLAAAGFEAFHGVEQAVRVGGGAQQVGGLLQGLVVFERDDDDGLVTEVGSVLVATGVACRSRVWIEVFR
jgi:hypothetical protein